MKVAVQVRAFQVTRKLLDLLDQLRGSPRYDLFLSFDETEAKAAIEGIRTFGYTLDLFASTGLPFDVTRHFRETMWRHADYPIYTLREAQPGYDVYISLEYDVDFVGGGRAVIERMIDALEAEGEQTPDLVIGFFATSYPSSPWYPAAARWFPTVYACMFSLQILTGRAIDRLTALRRAEATRGTPDEFMFCEAFVASALGNDDAFRCLPLETFLPGCIERESYHPGLPMLMGHLPSLPQQVRLVHPVYAEPECLAKRFFLAQAHGTLPDFLIWLKEGDGRFVSPEAQKQYLWAARTALDGGPPKSLVARVRRRLRDLVADRR